ncbi:DUF6083 domain-containing protein [Streptomyces monashensis]|uniref:DUF6083 domain-containing protein n=1 Tax=Streptomyces monashensis TaxID=1678012 RepID=UPI0033CBA8B5
MGTRWPWEPADRAQAAVDGATGPAPPAPPVCPNCRLPGGRRPTYTGRHVLLEPVPPLPAHLVPAGHRWTIDTGAGIAWNRGLDDLEPWARLTSLRAHKDLPMVRACASTPHRAACEIPPPGM